MTSTYIEVANSQNAIANQPVSLVDNGNLDSFGRLRVSNPTGVFDCQLTYGLQPILMEPITAESGATITHDATNRNALMTFSSTPTGGKAYMQTFQHFRYQPGKSQLVLITFNFLEAKANVLKFAGYSDGTNGIEFQNNGIVNRFVLYSSTTHGNQTANQANWNLDKLDGTGASGITLDVTKAQILILDFQALYTGRVRIGFDIDGTVLYAHEFLHANLTIHPYIQTANLPIRCGMTCTGTVSTTMKFQCCSVLSEGGVDWTYGYNFSKNGNVTAADNAATHAMSIRPKTTFNSIANRSLLGFVDVNILVTGNSSVYWELCIGQAISGTTTYADCNTTYSAVEFNTAGTLSGSPAIVIDAGFVGASNNTKGASSSTIHMRYPITLDAAGAARAMGTITLTVKGVTAASACYYLISWLEIR